MASDALELVNLLYTVAFSAAVIYIGISLVQRLYEFRKRRAEVKTPVLLWRDAIFFLCLFPFAGAILLGRIYDPLRQVLRDNVVWQLVTGLLIVIGVLVFAWYERFVVGRVKRDPYEDGER